MECFFTTAVVVLASLTMVGCTKKVKHAYKDLRTLRTGARAESLGLGRADTVRVYLDTSGSMRGFALAATDNQSNASNELQSILTAIDSIPSALGTDEHHAMPTAVPGGAAAAARTRSSATVLNVSRFGAKVGPLPTGVTLLSAGLGRTLLPTMGGEALPRPWISSDCGAKWHGSPPVRTNIDSLFSERLTCLNHVFDEILQDKSRRQAHVLITDAEQDAPEDSRECPAARNLGNIQQRIYEWVHDQGNFAALVVVRMRSAPWQSLAVGDRFCGCGEKNLYVYLFTPSAELAERIYSHIASMWSSAGGSRRKIGYLPFAPRPASQFTVRMAVEKHGTQRAAALPMFDDIKDLRDPETSVLPVFTLKLKDAEATVRFSVGEVGFEEPNLQPPDFYRLDWKNAQYDWAETPARLEVKSVAGRGASPREQLVRSEQLGGLTFVRPAELATGTYPHRDARFHARSRLLARAQLVDLPHPVVAYRIRRRPSVEHGCEIYLLQLTTNTVDQVKRISDTLPVVQTGLAPCTDMEKVKDQIRYAYRPSPIVRFLLHIDY
jgi:hypothetical protein